MRALFDDVGAHCEAFQPLTRLQQRTGHVGGSHQNSGYPDRPAKTETPLKDYRAGIEDEDGRQRWNWDVSGALALALIVARGFTSYDVRKNSRTQVQRP